MHIKTKMLAILSYWIYFLMTSRSRSIARIMTKNYLDTQYMSYLSVASLKRSCAVDPKISKCILTKLEIITKITNTNA